MRTSIKMLIHQSKSHSVCKQMVRSLICCIIIYISSAGLAHSKRCHNAGSGFIGHRYEYRGRVNHYNAPITLFDVNLISTNIDFRILQGQINETIIFYSLTFISILFFLLVVLYCSYIRTRKRNRALKETIAKINEDIEKPEWQVRDAHHDFVQRATAIINNEMCNHQFSSKVLAEKMFMSISQLNRRLTAATGHASYHLIAKTRIEAAKEKLANEDKAISQIAAECGFYDTSHFSRTFKQHTKVTPTQFRKSI